MIPPQLELALGAQHPLAHLSPDLARADLEASRQRRARRRIRIEASSPHPRACDDAEPRRPARRDRREPESICRIADLAGADLTKAELNGAEMTKVTLVKAVLVGANMENAILHGAELTDAEQQTVVAGIHGFYANQATQAA